MRNLFINLSLLFMSLFLGLLILEVGLRLFLPQEDIVVKSDREIGWVLRENLDAIWRREVEYKSGYATFRTNKHGIRESHILKDPDYTIYMLGDSFIQAANVNEEDTATEILQRLLSKMTDCHIEALNLGVQGYGPIHAYHWYLRNYENLPKPDLIVYSFWLGDDFESSYVRSSSPTKLTADLQEGQVIEVSPLVSENFFRNTFLVLASNSDLIRYFKHHIYPLFPQRNLDLKLRAMGLRSADIGFGGRGTMRTQEDVKAMVKIAMHYLVQMRNLAAKDGADFLVSFIPRGIGVTHRTLYTHLTHSLIESDIAVAHFSDVPGVLENPDAWYVGGNGHFGIAGNWKYAEFLGSNLYSRYRSNILGRCNQN